MLADRLKEVREKSNKTQNDLAEYLMVKRQTYSAYERGVSLPDASTLSKLADYFGVTTDYLLGRTGHPQAKLVNPSDPQSNIIIDAVSLVEDAINSGLTKEDIEEMLNVIKKFKTKD